MSASGKASASPANDRLGVFGQLAGKDRRLGDAVEDLPVEPLARLGHADDRLERLAGVADLGFACRADRGERDHVDLRADPFGAGDRLAVNTRRIASSRSWLA